MLVLAVANRNFPVNSVDRALDSHTKGLGSKPIIGD